MAYNWDKSYETGYAAIDNQHKELIRAINDLLSACASGKGRDSLDGTIAFLESYTDKHFSDEERLQKQFGYPDAVNHKRLHDGFKATVRELGQHLKAEGPTVALVGKVNKNIGEWLITHIKREDTKVAAHIVSKK